jgi:mono/diheme cytochrome c family protein
MRRAAPAVLAAALAAALAGCGGSETTASVSAEGTTTAVTVTTPTVETTTPTVTSPQTVSIPGLGTVTLPQATAANPVAKGKQVFDSAGCAGCHTFEAAGATGTTGPNLDTQLSESADAAGQPLPVFVFTSIVAPDAFVAKGYSAGVMPSNFRDTLSGEQIAELVAFITANA